MARTRKGRRGRIALSSNHGMENHRIIDSRELSRKTYLVDMFGDNNVVLDTGFSFALVGISKHIRRVNRKTTLLNKETSSLNKGIR